MIALLLAIVLPPCHVWDTARKPLGPGIHFFQVQDTPFVNACRAPVGTKEALIAFTVRGRRGCLWAYPKTGRDAGGGIVWYEAQGLPTVCWSRRTVTVTTWVGLGIEWIPPDLAMLIQSRDPVHLSTDLLETR